MTALQDERRNCRKANAPVVEIASQAQTRSSCVSALPSDRLNHQAPRSPGLYRFSISPPFLAPLGLVALIFLKLFGLFISPLPLNHLLSA